MMERFSNKAMPGSGATENKVALAERIADIRASILRKKGICRDDDLIEVGFTQSQLDQTRDLVKGLAGVDANAANPDPAHED